MKLTITPQNLTRGLNAVTATIPTRSSLPVLSNVLLEADGDGVSVSGTDLDVSVRIRVPAEVTDPGSVTVPGKKFQELARELPDHPVSLEAKGEQLEGSCGRSRFKLNGLPSEEFPTLPEVDFDEGWAVVSSDLDKLISATSFAASTEESRPILNGVLWELKPEEMVMVATNGHRLARMAVKTDRPTASDAMDGLIVAPAALGQARRLFEEADELRVAKSGNHLGFRSVGSVDAQVYTRLIEGKYPNYEQVIPRDNDKIATVEREALLSAVRRMAVVAADPPHRVRLRFEADRLLLDVRTSDLGEAEDEVAMEYQGDQQEIGFNAQYMLEILRNMPAGNDVRFEFKTAERAATMEPVDEEEDYLCLIMPLRLD